MLPPSVGRFIAVSVFLLGAVTARVEDVGSQRGAPLGLGFQPAGVGTAGTGLPGRRGRS